MADFKEIIAIDLDYKTGGYSCYWEKQDLADESIDYDWDLNVSLSDSIKFLRKYNYDTDYAIRKLVNKYSYYKECEY